MIFRSPDGERLLTTAEMSQRFGMSQNTVCRWAQTGRVPGAVKGRVPTAGGLQESWLFPESAVAVLVEDSARERAS
jgi:predicted DNA-binding transcriptional regulator AlpA